MPQFEGTVEEFEGKAESYSDEELAEFARDDDRVGVQNAAQSVLDARQNTPDDTDTDVDPEDDRLARAEAAGINVEGVDLRSVEPQKAEVQEKADAVEESGKFPPDGPPSDAHTVAAVVEREAASKEMRDE